jgi:hypothetical protein
MLHLKCLDPKVRAVMWLLRRLKTVLTVILQTVLRLILN